MRTTVERARDAASREAWPEAYALLHDLDERDLAPEDWDALADACWWLCRLADSVAARQKAYAGYAAGNADREAGAAAWSLYLEYHLTGRVAVAGGWLRRAHRHLDSEPECREHALLALAECDLAQLRGDLDAAMAHASRMTEIARRCGSADLVAMGLQAQGGVLLRRGKISEGLAVLDEAMCAVVAGELSALYTGWVYCQALAYCMDIADVRRAAEWVEAALAWCASLPTVTPYHGMCRVHQVEVLGLRGAWAQAEADARRTYEELSGSYPEVAAEAFYVAGEIRRRMGDVTAAEQAFGRAHELGREPQPGLALLRLAQGKPEAAAAALRITLADQGGGRWWRARLLAAQVEVALAMGDLDGARAAAGELDSLAQESGTDLMHATAAMARGAVWLAENDADRALWQLRRARALWLELGLPYETARTRMLLAAACRAAGDGDGARMELRAAVAVFSRLGSAPDARRAAGLLGGRARVPSGLTPREAEVLRLVAAGMTNRSIAAELVISEHTVARHLNNIFAKLGVSSRAAATAFAFTHDLV